ncbi:DUF4199 domain-containing protein [Lacihabitans sp. LS3-19]|uniref:DUF4199 domain-containing protein n=1 Tax=Lacihabitans sp. LS3-19 TaxID=2487335 RepID=UPI0020CD489F|nr:DUF4199 domain-containing protein [Lacihabitans sp. LS3-19]MCP9770211.1 DUF4199 domain-containing protein [Lacihabitans sp. LS3-19]
MKQIILKNGIIAGLAISVFMVCSMAYVYNSEHGEGSMLIGYASMLAAFSFIFIGIKKYRDAESDGKITFFTAIKIGIAISAIASLMYVIAWGIEYHFFMPDFLDKYIASSIEKLQKSNLSTTELESKIKEIENSKGLYDNIFSFSLVTFAEIFPVGLLVTIVSSFILKKK